MPETMIPIPVATVKAHIDVLSKGITALSNTVPDHSPRRLVLVKKMRDLYSLLIQQVIDAEKAAAAEATPTGHPEGPELKP